MALELSVAAATCITAFALHYFVFNAHARSYRRLFNAFSLWHDPTPIQKRVLFHFSALSLASERRRAFKVASARRGLSQCAVDGEDDELQAIGSWLASMKRPEERGFFTVIDDTLELLDLPRDE